MAQRSSGRGDPPDRHRSRRRHTGRWLLKEQREHLAKRIGYHQGDRVMKPPHHKDGGPPENGSGSSTRLPERWTRRAPGCRALRGRSHLRQPEYRTSPTRGD